MLGSVVSGIASGLAGKAMGSLFGGGSAAGAGGVGPLLLNAGGFGTGFDEFGRLTIGSRPYRKALIDGIANSFTDQAQFIRDQVPGFRDAFASGISDLNKQIEQVVPGFGRLTNARVDAIQNARGKTMSNLVDQQARRRISGSSFAQDSILSAEREFAEQEELARAESFLQELELTNQLQTQKNQLELADLDTAYNMLNSAFSMDRAADQTQLDELNFQLDVVLRMMAAVQAQQNRNADLAVQDAVAQNKFAGSLFGGFGGFGGQEMLWGSPISGTGITFG